MMVMQVRCLCNLYPAGARKGRAADKVVEAIEKAKAGHVSMPATASQTSQTRHNVRLWRLLVVVVGQRRPRHR